MLMFGEIARKFFPKQGLYYIDLWPLSAPFIVVVSPKVAIQATRTTAILAMERPAQVRRYFLPIAGGPNMFDLPEKQWRPWRATFNKAFSAEHVLSLIPNMVEQTLTYREILRTHAQKGNMFYLDPTTLRFTMDLIGRTIL